MSFYPAQAQLSDDTLASSDPSILNLAISNMTLGESATGLTSVNGIVINNSSENVENVKVDVTIYDTSNNVLRETSRFITNPFTIFEPSSTENFNFLMSAGDFHNYTAKAYADKAQ
jgi:hypothetical protein